MDGIRRWRLLIVATLGTLLVFLALFFIFRGNEVPRQGGAPAPVTGGGVCGSCHARATPAITLRFNQSVHAKKGVDCLDCHRGTTENPETTEHKGLQMLPAPTPKTCGNCHQPELEQYKRSAHAGKAWLAMTPEGLSEEELTQIQARQPNIILERNVLFDKEGPNVTPAACESCHGIGRPRADGSVGDCSECHLEHKFSKAQARRPESCNRCHIGPDHPQFEIYMESPHGILYTAEGETWNWDAPSGALSVQDMPAPTCATCHMSGLGGTGVTHDVGERLSLYLFATVSEFRPEWRTRRSNMFSVCLQCHSKTLVEDFYGRADSLLKEVNERVEESKAIMKALKDDGLITEEPFDEPIEFVSFDLWHYYGRTAKFGAYMDGPDYVQWHGYYPLLDKLATLKDMAADIRARGGTRQVTEGGAEGRSEEGSGGRTKGGAQGRPEEGVAGGEEAEAHGRFPPSGP